jgi:hypothetical protein
VREFQVRVTDYANAAARVGRILDLQTFDELSWALLADSAGRVVACGRIDGSPC